MMGSRDGEWGGLEVLMVNSSNTPSSALRAWVVKVRISNRDSFLYVFRMNSQHYVFLVIGAHG